MTSLILESNKASPLLSTLQAIDKVQDLSYFTKKSVPNMAKKLRKISPRTQPSSGSADNQTVIFDVPKGGYWAGAAIMTSGTSVALTAGSIAKPIGFSMFSNVEIQSNGVVVQTLSDIFIEGKAQKTAGYDHLTRLAYPLNSSTYAVSSVSDTSFTTFTPLFSSFFDRPENFVDLSYYEQLNVSCKFNTDAKRGSEAFTDASVYLYVWTVEWELEYREFLRSKNQAQALMNMLCINSVIERKTLTSNTENTITLYTNVPAVRTYVGVRILSGANAAAYVRIDTLKLELGGETLIDTSPAKLLDLESALMGSMSITAATGTTVRRVDSDLLCIEWGLSEDSSSLSGAVSFNRLNNPVLTVAHASVTAANYELVVVHEYVNIVSFDNQNGSVRRTMNV